MKLTLEQLADLRASFEEDLTYLLDDYLVNPNFELDEITDLYVSAVNFATKKVIITLVVEQEDDEFNVEIEVPISEFIEIED